MNRYVIVLSFGILLFLYGCNNAPGEKQKNAFSYFDIRSYAGKEAARLTRKNALVTKTVIVNGTYETRKLKITDWERELSPLANADINKASWRSAFTVHQLKDRTVYRSNDEKIPVKEVTVLTQGIKVVGLLVLVKNTNALYTSTDSLTYYPDSLYQIRKTQQIKLLSGKNYEITLKF